MADDQMQSGPGAVDELVDADEPLADGQVGEVGQPGDAAVEDGGTRLPADPAIAELADHGRNDFISVVRDHPESSLCWALLAEGALLAGTEEADIAGYSYAVTGFHAGISALRAAGWQGRGGIAWEHLTNQGFLRCVWARSVAADRIGQADESTRCEQFLHRASESAWQQLHTTLVPADPSDPADTAEGPGDDE
ncbi:DUF3151 family protein [Acidipropionibacterium thoenii]|uniref:DUF3151 family protein n=1 Tax=Acidipropionibacterium thoenii TaxID=1751 RepID=UPI001FE23EF1|nr:DUF3151 family protein [Acidipropionibacterium thoenii]